MTYKKAVWVLAVVSILGALNSIRIINVLEKRIEAQQEIMRLQQEVIVDQKILLQRCGQ